MEMVLGVVRPEMAIDLGSKEMKPMIDEGLSMGNPRTDLGLLKVVRVACWIKMVHVNLLAYGCLA